MPPGTVHQLGRRERGKLDKRRRIREATREVFRRNGYENATTREIADLADVAVGTLFAYAADKRELLMMVVNDDRESFPEVGENIVDGRKEILQLLMTFFEPRYRYWAKEPELSRAVVQETVAYHRTKEPGPELARFYAGRQMMIGNLAHFFERGQRRGQIIETASPTAIARLFMTIYQGEVRQWLQADQPSASNGLAQLQRSFQLALSGVKISRER